MKHSVYPSFSEFKKLSRKGNLIALYSEVMADQVTPVALVASQWKSAPYCSLLESVEGGEKLGRYSIVSFEPDMIFTEQQGQTAVQTASGQVMMRYPQPALDVLERYLNGVKPVRVEGLPRFFGGAIGFCSYEMVHNLETIPPIDKDVLKWPTARFFITGDLFVFDNTQQILKVITCVRLSKGRHLKTAYEEGVKRLAKNVKMIEAIRPVKPVKVKSASASFTTNVSQAQFIKAVKKAKAYIAKGDIIQVVLSRRNEKKTKASPLDIYRALRVVNPSPYMYLVKMKDRAIIGSSPEALVRLENGIASTRPIAGTRRRGETPEDDARLERELIQDPKERAEHLMLVDLGRNDLGRVCNYGTVQVPKLMTIERYSHVMHIVSEVVGKIKSGKGPFDLLRACFPAGTVSGAPKIRAMEIISQLEREQRGPYAGAIGYIAYSGNMDMAITIRTILWDKGRVSIQTGAGLVADSNPNHEFQETENKAAGMKKTILLAEGHI